VHYADRDPSIYVSAVDVLDGRVPPDKIEGKLVLVGTSAIGMNDIKTTPGFAGHAGRRIHAQVLESALPRRAVPAELRDRDLNSPAPFLLGLLVIASRRNLGPAKLVALGALFASLLMGTSWYFYIHDRLLVDFTYPLLSTTAIYLTLIFSSFVPRAGAAAPDPFGLRPVPLARAGRAARAVAGKARARRRGARDDHHVLRRPRLHPHLGKPTRAIRKA